MGSDGSLIRTFIGGKAYVPIDAHHRAASRSRIRDEARIDLLQGRLKICNQMEKGIAHPAFVTSAIVLKPCAFVVGSQIFQKLQ